MLRPLLHLFATQPQLLGEHAQAYAELVTGEALKFAARWKRQALLRGLAFVALVVSVLLAGMALLLWASLPAEPRMPWVLIAVPLPPLVAALACWLGARERDETERPFANVRRQFEADQALWREVSGT